MRETPSMISSAQGRVADAAVACIAEHGLEGASVRLVAARAGVSIGAVQHHYPTKDALLAAAMTQVETTFRQRLADSTSGNAAPDELLRRTVRALVPAGDEERRAAALWIAFVARAAVHAPTAEHHRSLWQGAEDLLAVLVSEAVRGAGAPPSQDEREAAAGLLALADGLSVAVLLEPARMSRQRAHRLVDAAVDVVLRRH